MGANRRVDGRPRQPCRELGKICCRRSETRATIVIGCLARLPENAYGGESQTLFRSKLMLRSLAQLFALVLATAVSGCAPPELTAPQEELVRRCLELAYKQE